MKTALRLTALLLAGLALPSLAPTSAMAQASAPATRPSANAPAAIPPGAVPGTTATRPSATAPASPAAATATSAATAARVPAQTGTTKVDINSGTEMQLDALPGIGPVRAKAIIAGRPWDDLDSLAKKGAVPQNVLNGARGQMALANINTTSAADMAKTLPGIGDARAKAIVAGRPYDAPQDLVTKKVLTQAAFDKVKDVLAY